jgi:hypothetical protein
VCLLFVSDFQLKFWFLSLEVGWLWSHESFCSGYQSHVMLFVRFLVVGQKFLILSGGLVLGTSECVFSH